MPVFQIGERIATPVCGLVRNDVVVTMVQTELFDKLEFACQCCGILRSVGVSSAAICPPRQKKVAFSNTLCYNTENAGFVYR